jgi:hypothetical protein
VFTVRYALSPYIKQTRFVFKGLIKVRELVFNNILGCSWVRIVRTAGRSRLPGFRITDGPLDLEWMFNWCVCPTTLCLLVPMPTTCIKNVDTVEVCIHKDVIMPSIVVKWLPLLLYIQRSWFRFWSYMLTNMSEIIRGFVSLARQIKRTSTSLKHHPHVIRGDITTNNRDIVVKYTRNKLS